jgi:hypothetical protein
MAAAHSSILCFEKEKLLREFAHAVSEYNRMHSAQLAAVLKDEDFPFGEEIAKAEQRKEEAKYAILAHRQEHGC